MAAAPTATGGSTTFLQLYAEPSQDPHDGVYDAPMGEFIIAPLGVGYNPNALYFDSLAVGTDVCNAYVGLFPYPNEDEGRTRLLHAPCNFP